MTSSNGNLSRYWPFVWAIHRSSVNSPHKCQWRRALMFSLIRACINTWANNREAGHDNMQCLRFKTLAWYNSAPLGVSFIHSYQLNSSPPCDAYMRQWIGAALVQVIVCRLLSPAKSLPETILAYCQLDSWNQISVKFESEFYHFHSRKCICIWNCRPPKLWSFCPKGDELY